MPLETKQVFKASLSKAQDVKALDRELARVQALVHNAVGPLLHLLTGMELEGLSVDEAQSTVQDTLRFVGNTSANLSELRRKRILKAPNPQMQDMAEEPELFQAAAPNLFSHDF